MVRLRLFGSGRVILMNEDNGEIIEDFYVPDPEKAQEVVMQYLQEIAKKARERE